MEQNPLNNKEKNVSELMVNERGELVRNTTEVSELIIEKKELLSDKTKLLLARIGKITGFGVGAVGSVGLFGLTGIEGYEILKHAHEGLSTLGDAEVIAKIWPIVALATVAGSFTALTLNDLVEKLKRKIQLQSTTTQEQS